MVEGPGATRNGWKLKNALYGEVLEVDIPNNNSAMNSNKVPKYSYEGHILKEFFTVGKELFLIFSSKNGSGEEIAMRLHFGMSGCLFVGTNPKIPPWRKKESHNLKLFLLKPKPSKKAKYKNSTTKSPKSSQSITMHCDEESSNKSHVIDLTKAKLNDRSMNENSKNTLQKYFAVDSSYTKNSPNNNNETNNFPSQTRDQSSSKGNKTPIFSNPKRTKENSENDNQVIIIETRNTTISVGVSANMARSKLQRLASLDVCSPSFHAAHVFQAIVDAGVRNENMIISDALLNQNLFPGIGNIIKIESLHRAKIDPRRKVSQLSHLDIRKVVAICRQFSMHWLNHVQTPPKLVYNRTTCGTCNQYSIKMQKLGGLDSISINSSTTHHLAKIVADTSHNHLSRVTFWCTFCQPLELISNINNDSSTTSSIASGKISLAPPPVHVLKPVMACPKHGDSNVILRRVHNKNSPNLSRIFRICRKKDCEFFSWADTKFPSCQCSLPASKAVLKISKTNKSGGRWFFCCSKPKDQGCGYFLWADKQHLEPLGAKITPLL